MAPEVPQTATLAALQGKITTIHRHLQEYIGTHGEDRLQSLWPDWDQRLQFLQKKCSEPTEVAISLVGGTGAGKSTLLNALIGARVLPVSSMRACTAAISEVSYSDGPYRGRVEFISRESWEKELELLAADLRDWRTHEAENKGEDERPEMTRVIEDKLKAVYKPEGSGKDYQIDWREIAEHRLVEPLDITEALNVGYIEFENENLAEFRKQVSQYLDSNHRFWPIVKTVKVSGRFEALKGGAKIIDLPGLNDPNEAREAVTKKHLKTCRFVWIIFNIKRALTKEMIHLMQSDDFARQIVMDGRTDALTFVGTASDDVDLDSGIEEFHLDEDVGEVEVIQARNKAARGVILSQLDDLAIRLAQLAQEESNKGAQLAHRLKASQIFMASAREYLRLVGLSKTRSLGLTEPKQTEIPQLCQHINDLCEVNGFKALHKLIDHQLNTLLLEIQYEAQAQQNALQSHAEFTNQQKEEIRAANNAAQTFLDQALKEARSRIKQDLSANQNLLSERIKLAVERAKNDLHKTLLRWDNMHWATVRATCRRDGVFVRIKGRVDFGNDLSKPILDGIAFAWADYFGERLGQTLKEWTTHLVERAHEYREKLSRSLTEDLGLAGGLTTDLDQIFENTERILSELLGQINTEMEGRIQEEQRTLYEIIPDQITANMKLAYKKAGEQKGEGMRVRMVAILSRHAKKIADEMFDEARESLMTSVRQMNDWLGREYARMTDAVHRNSQLAAQNLVVEGEQLAGESLENEKNRVNQLGSFVASLMREYSS